MHASKDRNGLSWVLWFTMTLMGWTAVFDSAAAQYSAVPDGASGPVVISAPAGQPTTVDQARARAQANNAALQAARAQAQAQAEQQAKALAEQQATAQASKPKAAPAKNEANKPDAAAGEKKEEKSETIQRPETPPGDVDPHELDVKLDEFGRVPPFNFVGQPWPAVLTWYAKLANCALDWQELPNSYVNVFTENPSALDDVRDLLNRYLLARGFTMLQRDRVISVFKIEDIDPSLVSRIAELDLYERKRYDFVKVAFELPEGMDVEKAKEDVKQVLSKNARVMPLVSTRQLLVIDAVANLQTVSELLNAERARRDGTMPIRTFFLKHRRAEEVIDILYVTLGLDPKSRPTQQELQVRQQELQLLNKLAQQNDTRASVAKMLKSDGPPVFLTFNSQNNSILANAPPEQMRWIEFTIEQLDVPLDEQRQFEDDLPLREFVLKHRRAEDVIDILYVTLGLDPKSRPSQMDLQVRRQELQIMQQMAQRGTDVSRMLKPDGPPVYLAYNRQRNSIIAHAPPDQMRMIEFTLKRLDVPLGGEVVDASDATVVAKKDVRTIQTYKLNTLNPEGFKTKLEQLGDLDPFTMLEADPQNRALLVMANAADHEKIAKLIADMDGEERQVRMIQLRRYPADLAAVTIRELIKGKKEDDQPVDPYYQYLMSRYSTNEPEDPHEGFYVAPDALQNRLLVRANKLEMEMIFNLLKEMGEVPTAGPDGLVMRVVEPGGGDLLDQLQKTWSNMGGNPLIIVPQEQAPATESPAAADEEKEEPTDGEAKKESTSEAPADRDVRTEPTARVMATLAGYMAPSQEAGELEAVTDAEKDTVAASADESQEASVVPANVDDEAGEVSPVAQDATDSTSEPAKPAGNASANAAASRPPVNITVTQDGRLVLSSEDPVALDRLETLIQNLSPPERRFKVFPLMHTSASSMYWNLYDMFEEELTADEGEMVRDWYTGRYVRTGEDRGDGLARRPKLMITYDLPSNSIWVANASPSQLREIDQLVKEFDKPAAPIAIRTRRHAAIKIKYSRASIIAAALKEAYVDLLSTRDREFDNGEGSRRQGSGQEKLTEIRYGDGSSEASPDEWPRVTVPFSGALSIGADDVSNMLVISCYEEFYDGIVQMVNKLDEESAPPTAFVVHAVSGSVSASSLQNAMSEAVGRPWLGGRPAEQAARGGGRGGQQGQNGGNNNRPGNNRGRNQRNGNR